MHNVIVPPEYSSAVDTQVIFLYGHSSWQGVAIDKIRSLDSNVWIVAPALRLSPVVGAWRSAYVNNPVGVESWISGMEQSLLYQASVRGVVVAWFSALQELYDSGSQLLEIKSSYSPHLLIGVDSSVARNYRSFLRGVLGTTHFTSLDDLCFASVEFIKRIKLRSEQNLTWV